LHSLDFRKELLTLAKGLSLPRVLTCAEGKTEAFTNGENVEVRRSPQAVACKKRYAVELGKPQRFRKIWSRMDDVQGTMKPDSSETMES